MHLQNRKQPPSAPVATLPKVDSLDTWGTSLPSTGELIEKKRKNTGDCLERLSRNAITYSRQHNYNSRAGK